MEKYLRSISKLLGFKLDYLPLGHGQVRGGDHGLDFLVANLGPQ